MAYVEVAPWTSVQGVSSTAKSSDFTSILNLSKLTISVPRQVLVSSEILPHMLSGFRKVFKSKFCNQHLPSDKRSHLIRRCTVEQCLRRCPGAQTPHPLRPRVFWNHHLVALKWVPVALPTASPRAQGKRLFSPLFSVLIGIGVRFLCTVTTIFLSGQSRTRER